MQADSPRFQLGQIVYRKLLPEVPGMITGIVFRQHGHCYLVCWQDEGSTCEGTHYEMELISEKSFVQKPC